MSARFALDTASRIGLSIDLDGCDLALASATPPPADVLDLLARYKHDIVAELRHRYDVVEWVATDWQAYLDERAGILEFDAGLPRTEAEARAYDDCVAEWLNRHPISSQPGRCITCGSHEWHGAAAVPFLTGVSAEAWLHTACWPAWREAREAMAIDALRKLGIARPRRGASR